jgi:hypothetical protein
MNLDITKEEKAAIAALKRLAKKWPESLWLFSASGTMNVMKCDDNGERVYHPQGTYFDGGGVDQDYCIDYIDIPNDGGDW